MAAKKKTTQTRTQRKVKRHRPATVGAWVQQDEHVPKRGVRQLTPIERAS